MRERPKTDSHPFGPPRRPVILPADAARPSMRAVATTVAIGMLLVGIVTGVVYHRTWEGASTDPTRLLPASAQAYARVDRPWGALRDALALERWRDPMALELGLEAEGFLAGRMTDQIAGIPLGTVRHILDAVDSLQLAVVPTPDGVGVLAFLHVEDAWERRRVLARLTPWTEPIDRQLGYDMRALSHPGELLPWSEPAVPIRMSAIDPHVVLSFGPEAALSDLIHAKVSGRSQPIRARDGFAPPAVRAPGDLWAFFDPASTYDALVRRRGTAPEDVAWRRALLVEGVRSMSARASMEAGREELELTARLSASGTLQSLPDLLQGESGALLGRAPADALLVADVALDDPLQSLAAWRDVTSRIRAELGDAAVAGDPANRALASGLELLQRMDPEVLAGFAGEAMLALLPSQDLASLPHATHLGGWLVVARVEAPRAVERALEVVLPTMLEGELAFGRLAMDDHDLHLVRPAVAAEGARPREILAWRVRGSLLEVASDRATLDALDRVAATGRTVADLGLSDEARRVGRGTANALLMLHPLALAEAGGPLAVQLTERLREDFRVFVALEGGPHLLTARTNLGPWTVGLSAAASTRAAIDRLVLGDVSPECRGAVDAFCERWPAGLACHPLDPGRAALIRAACRRLGL